MYLDRIFPEVCTKILLLSGYSLVPALCGIYSSVTMCRVEHTMSYGQCFYFHHHQILFLNSKQNQFFITWTWSKKIWNYTLHVTLMDALFCRTNPSVIFAYNCMRAVLWWKNQDFAYCPPFLGILGNRHFPRYSVFSWYIPRQAFLLVGLQVFLSAFFSAVYFFGIFNLGMPRK